jgi:osmotically-inducible protein OsmY
LKLKTFPAAATFGALLAVASATMALEMRSNVGPTQADWTLALQVKQALLENLGADSLHVAATCHRGAVTLTGNAGDRRRAEEAGSVAKSVVGVRSVRNDVLSAGTKRGSHPAAGAAAASEVQDALLETRLRLALIRSMGDDGFHIGSGATSGVVTLSFDHDLRSVRRQRALGVARRLEGVSRVIVVDRPAKT